MVVGNVVPKKEDVIGMKIELFKALKVVFWFLLIIGVLFLIINQAFGFFYKVQFLKTPCGLCEQLNPEVKTCISQLNSPQASYPIGNGSWTDPFKENKVYNITRPA